MGIDYDADLVIGWSELPEEFFAKVFKEGKPVKRVEKRFDVNTGERLADEVIQEDGPNTIKLGKTVIEVEGDFSMLCDEDLDKVADALDAAVWVTGDMYSGNMVVCITSRKLKMKGSGCTVDAITPAVKKDLKRIQKKMQEFKLKVSTKEPTIHAVPIVY